MRQLLLVLTLTTFGITATQAQNFVRQKTNSDQAANSETFRSMTFNGAWCWFSDPRAVYHEGKHKRTYAGWVDNYGDIHVGYYDHETDLIQSKVIYDGLEIDDHDNPSILFDEEGKLMVFFNKHLGGAYPLYIMKATESESIENWTVVKELHLNDPNKGGSLHHTYTNPYKLSGEGGRIYLFWRGADGKPSYSWSDDNGDNWAPGKIFFMPEPTYAYRRPYTKIYSDGIDKIHITVTDGHPRNESENSIYYMYYQKGAFYKADGTKIKTVDQLPIEPQEADMLYSGKTGGARAWNWDVAQDELGNPVVTYVKFPDEENHIYCYARWYENAWHNYDLINSGPWFPQTPEGEKEVEANYSAGLNIDHESPNTLYLSVKRDSFFELEKWETFDKGKSWSVTAITKNSKKDNVRPFAVRGAKPGNPLQVLWMQNTKYLFWAYIENSKGPEGKWEDRFHASIKMDMPAPLTKNPLEAEQITNIMYKVADWQLSNPRRGVHAIDWQYGALYTGIRALHELTGADRYKNEMLNVGQKYDWQVLNHIFYADYLVVIDNWCWLYSLDKKPEMIDKSQFVMDIHLARRYKDGTDVRFKDNPNFLDWWTWCDALYMAPPSFVEMWKVTGEEKYLKYMDTQWWKTSDYLYSTADSLYFRDDRYFEKRSENNNKIMWARGNGWVMAGLARILDDLPKDYPNRKKFEQQYKEMAHKLLSIQDEDGLWRVSLLDPNYIDLGESSGSSFFTFALAWGLNNGLIDQSYRPQVEKAWTALCNNVNSNGRLGFVQNDAADPYPFKESEWNVFATGAFLLAGKEMVELVK